MAYLCGTDKKGRTSGRASNRREEGWRELRRKRVSHARRAAEVAREDELLDQREWHERMIKRECAIIGAPTVCNCHHWPLVPGHNAPGRRGPEPTGLRVVQTLWLAVIVLLVLATLD